MSRPKSLEAKVARAHRGLSRVQRQHALSAHACTSPSRSLFRTSIPLAPKLLHTPHIHPHDPVPMASRGGSAVSYFRRHYLCAPRTRVCQCLKSSQRAAHRAVHSQDDGGMIARSTLGDKRPLFVHQTALPRRLWACHRASGRPSAQDPWLRPRAAQRALETSCGY